MPKIAMLEGYQGVGTTDAGLRRVSRRRLSGARGSMGSLMCGELDPIISKIGAALGEARRVGVPEDDARYTAAYAVWDKQSGWWSGQDFMMPGTCRNLVTEANSLLSGLNAAIGERGGTTLPQTIVPTEAPSITAGLSEVKWIAFGVLGVMGLFYFGPVVAGLVKGRKKR